MYDTFSALNVDTYTHFTSPIRRFADVMVHRMLQYSIDVERKQRASAEDDSHSHSQERLARPIAEFVPRKVRVEFIYFFSSGNFVSSSFCSLSLH